MTPTNTLSVLVVDRSDSFAPELRQRLAPLGIRVHVVNSPATALLMANAKRIDVAVLEYAMDRWTEELSAALKRRAVSIVYMTPGESGRTSARDPAYSAVIDTH